MKQAEKLVSIFQITIDNCQEIILRAALRCKTPSMRFVVLASYPA